MWGVCLVGLAILYGCGPESDQVPDHLIGTWNTTTPGYEQQHLFIARSQIGFGVTSTDANGYAITKVDEEREFTRLAYTISYMDADRARYKLLFYYEPTDGGRITFKNQDHLTWTRKAGAS